MIRYLKSPFAIAGLISCACLMVPVMTHAGESESVATVVAVHIRNQGFRCENPISAQHIAADSAPNHTVYILKCEGNTYRVVLVPDQAALVAEVN